MERTGAKREPDRAKHKKWSGTTKHFGMLTTPSAALRWAAPTFIDAAATPPISGGELPGPKFKPTHYRRFCIANLKCSNFEWYNLQ